MHTTTCKAELSFIDLVRFAQSLLLPRGNQIANFRQPYMDCTKTTTITACALTIH